jgi:hypothetical protein
MTDTPTPAETASTPADDCRRYQRNIRPAGRVMFCARCGHATGGGYGHLSGWCKALGKMRESHLCCPESCSLDAVQPVSPIAPCHPAPNMIGEWAHRVDDHGASIESRPTPLADVPTEQHEVVPAGLCPRGCPYMECYCSDGSEPRWCGHGPGGDCRNCGGCYACDGCHCGGD